MASQRRTDLFTFSSFHFNGRPPPHTVTTAPQPGLLDEDASYSSGSENEHILPYHAPTTNNSSWDFTPDDTEAEMRRLRSVSAAQKQKAVEEEKLVQPANVRATRAAAKGKGKAKAVVESEEEEEEEMDVSDPDAEGEEVDIEASEDDTKSFPVAEDLDSEDDDAPQSPQKPRLKIKLKLPTVPASSTSNTATPVPEEQKITPSRRAVAKRNAAVRGRRRIQDMESSSSEIESEDGDGADSEQEAEDEENEEDEEIDVSNTPSRAQQGGKARSMTKRQAVLASVVDSSHVALDSDLAAQSVQGTTNKRKKVLNENELALRREENARKRKNLTEKRLEDEKLETINRLLKKQTRPRAKRSGGPSHSAGSSVPPAPSAGSSTSTRGGKRGGFRGGARGKGRRGGRPRALAVTGGDEEGEEAEGEADGDAMDVDGQGQEADVDGDVEEELEREDEGVGEGSVGSEVSKSNGPVVPMFKWVSTTIFPQATEPEPAADSSAKEDVEMTDVTQDTPAAEGTQSNPDKDATSSALINTQERQMQMYFAIPTAFLPTQDQTVSTPPLGPRPPATCAVSGCEVPRKYRLVKNWTIGACGMEHLKVLEGMSG